jgi:hypothetical protein
MSHSQTVQTRRRKARARKLLEGAAKRQKKLRNRTAKPAAASARKSA